MDEDTYKDVCGEEGEKKEVQDKPNLKKVSFLKEVKPLPTNFMTIEKALDIVHSKKDSFDKCVLMLWEKDHVFLVPGGNVKDEEIIYQMLWWVMHHFIDLIVDQGD